MLSLINHSLKVSFINNSFLCAGIVSESCRNHVGIVSDSCRIRIGIVSESFRNRIIHMPKKSILRRWYTQNLLSQPHGSNKDQKSVLEMAWRPRYENCINKKIDCWWHGEEIGPKNGHTSTLRTFPKVIIWHNAIWCVSKGPVQPKGFKNNQINLFWAVEGESPQGDHPHLRALNNAFNSHTNLTRE